MTTNNAVNVPLSGNTGTGNFVGATSPTLVTPILGAATATSLTFNPTTGGIIGTTTNNNPTAGDVGEVISAQVLAASPVILTTTVVANVTSISLTAGDWEISGNVYFASNSSFTGALAGINTVSATLPDSSLQGNISAVATLVAFATPLVSRRLSLAGTTTVYLVADAVFSAGTTVASGYIEGRRMR